MPSGANSIATSAMLKAGADAAATGENAVCVGCRKADVIAGPVGIVIADALLGEITPKMAAAIGPSDAKRVLVPVNHCDNIVVGVGDIPMAKLVQSAVKEIGKCRFVNDVRLKNKSQSKEFSQTLMQPEGGAKPRVEAA